MKSTARAAPKSVAVIHNHPIHYKQLLFNAMVDNGVRLTVLYISSKSAIRHAPQSLTGSKYDFVIGSETPYENVNPFRMAGFVWRQLNRLKPAVVIFGGYCDAAVWCAWTWALIYRRPGILWAETNQNDRPRVAWKEMLKRIFLKRCAGAHVYGAGCRAYLGHLGLATERIVLKRAVVNTDRFTFAGPVRKGEHADLRLLYVGRLSPEKNLPFLLRAIQRATESSWGARLRLQVVGYGPQDGELRGLAKSLGIAGRVEFLGSREQEELPEVYREADVFVLPSLREPYGLVVLEALSAGTPVALSTRCGCAHDLEASLIGWHFDPEQNDSIDAVLKSAASLSKNELSLIGERGRKISGQFSPDACAKRVQAALLHLTCNPAGRVLPFSADTAFGDASSDAHSLLPPLPDPLWTSCSNPDLGFYDLPRQPVQSNRGDPKQW